MSIIAQSKDMAYLDDTQKDHTLNEYKQNLQKLTEKQLIARFEIDSLRNELKLLKIKRGMYNSQLNSQVTIFSLITLIAVGLVGGLSYYQFNKDVSNVFDSFFEFKEEQKADFEKLSRLSEINRGDSNGAMSNIFRLVAINYGQENNYYEFFKYQIRAASSLLEKINIRRKYGKSITESEKILQQILSKTWKYFDSKVKVDKKSKKFMKTNQEEFDSYLDHLTESDLNKVKINVAKIRVKFEEILKV